MEVSQGLVGAGKSHKKHSMIWMTKLHPLQEGVLAPSQADYTRIVTDAEVVVALKEGFVLAQNSATECQMNPSTSASNTVWWKKPWEIERKGVRFGGWCDVNVETLTDLTDTLEPETTPIQSTVETSTISTVVIEPLATAEEDSLSDDASEVALAGADVRVAMDDMYADLVYGVEKPNVRPTVCMEGRVVYKSTMVSQLVENPGLSKDKLTRVKQSVYFNNLVDKPCAREGIPTMFITVGSDCGVYFLEAPPAPRETRATEAIAKALKGRGRGKGKKVVNPKRPRGSAVHVLSTKNDSYVWWIGRVQSIQRKYGNKVSRSREAVDLLDKPDPEAACKVVFN